MQQVKRVVSAIGVVTLALVCAVSVRGGEERKAEKRGQEYFGGTISAIDFKAQTVTVKKKDGVMTFRCASDCKFFAERVKEGAKLSDFKVGDKVEVYYTVANGEALCHRLAEKGSHADKKEKREEKQAK